jgi:hypothetical protein
MVNTINQNIISTLTRPIRNDITLAIYRLWSNSNGTKKSSKACGLSSLQFCLRNSCRGFVIFLSAIHIRYSNLEHISLPKNFLTTLK